MDYLEHDASLSCYLHIHRRSEKKSRQLKHKKLFFYLTDSEFEDVKTSGKLCWGKKETNDSGSSSHTRKKRRKLEIFTFPLWQAMYTDAWASWEVDGVGCRSRESRAE